MAMASRVLRSCVRLSTQTRILPQAVSAASIHTSHQQRAPPPERIWKAGRLNHVAIAVPDLDKATAFYRDVLGATVSEKHAQPDHGVYTVFVELGDAKIELLYPMGDKSPIANFLEKNKAGGMHHICIEVNNINEAIADLRKQNIRTLGKEAKIGAHNKPVMFLHPKDCNGVLVELEEV